MFFFTLFWLLHATDISPEWYRHTKINQSDLQKENVLSETFSHKGDLLPSKFLMEVSGTESETFRQEMLTVVANIQEFRKLQALPHACTGISAHGNSGKKQEIELLKSGIDTVKNIREVQYHLSDSYLNQIKGYQPKLKKYYQDGNGTLWVIGVVGCARDIYIYTHNRYENHVGAINQHYLQLILSFIDSNKLRFPGLVVVVEKDNKDNKNEALVVAEEVLRERQKQEREIAETDEIKARESLEADVLAKVAEWERQQQKEAVAAAEKAAEKKEAQAKWEAERDAELKREKEAIRKEREQQQIREEAARRQKEEADLRIQSKLKAERDAELERESREAVRSYKEEFSPSPHRPLSNWGNQFYEARGSTQPHRDRTEPQHQSPSLHRGAPGDLAKNQALPSEYQRWQDPDERGQYSVNPDVVNRLGDMRFEKTPAQPLSEAGSWFWGGLKAMQEGMKKLGAVFVSAGNPPSVDDAENAEALLNFGPKGCIDAGGGCSF